MGTLKALKGSDCLATTVSAAWTYIKEHESGSVVIYSSDRKKLADMVEKIYKKITEKNVHIPNVDDQILPISPYYWDDIDGCLGVRCAEIGYGPFKDMADGLCLFGEFCYYCLTDPSARKPLSTKALTALAMIGASVQEGRSAK